MCKLSCVPVLALIAMASFAADFNDQEFVKEAAMGGMFEVKAGKLATEKGGDHTRAMGAQMVADHGTANDELKALAQKKNWTLVDGLGPKHDKTIERLSALSAADFDREYTAEMLKDHQEDFQAFKKASESASDADLKAFAAKTLPMIERHLKHFEGMTGASSAQANNVPPPQNQPPNNFNREINTTGQRFDQNNQNNIASQNTTTNQSQNPNVTTNTSERTFDNATYAPSETRYYTETADGQRTYIDSNTFQTSYDSNGAPMTRSSDCGCRCR